MIVVGTAGHIDHGKTTLIRTLTGIETDRLKEEQQRGISIELGFAYLDLADGSRVGLIDVPGHERFVHHMIAGATGVDLVLLVVAADEGVMPQTREHVAICELLGMKRGIVVLSKVDLVDADWLELVRDDIRQYLAGTFLGTAPMLSFSSTFSSVDLEAFRQGLYQEIQAQVKQVEKAAVRRPFMMPVDRVFTIKGFGTVVTGTVQSGEVKVGDTVEVLPAGLQTKVRRLEIHGRQADDSRAGTRTAANLPDVEKLQIERGNVLVAPGAVTPVHRVTVSLRALPSLQGELKEQFKVLFHTGSAMAEASVRLLDRQRLSGGERALASIRLSSPLAVLPGNRYIVRGFTTMADYGKTIGGGTILWPDSVKASEPTVAMLNRIEQGSPADRIEALAWLGGYGGVARRALPYLTPTSAEELEPVLTSDGEGFVRLEIGSDERLLHGGFYKEMTQRVIEVLREFHTASPRKRGMAREELKSRMPAFLDKGVVHAVLTRLEREGRLAGDEVLVALASFKPKLDDRFVGLLARTEKLLASGGLAPPLRDALMDELSSDERELGELLTNLVEAGKATRISSDYFLHTPALDEARKRLVAFMTTRETVSTQDLKDLFGLSRKYLIPLIEHFDATKLTVRVGTMDRKLRGK